MRLTGIELRNYKSIGDEPVVLVPWRKCNILVGQNNAGKSNVIAALQRISDLLHTNVEELTEIDRHKRSQAKGFQFTLHFEGDAPEDKELARIAGTSYFEFKLSEDQTRVGIVDCNFLDQAIAVLDHLLPAGGYKKLEGYPQLQAAGTVFRRQFASSVPRVHIIPEFRRIQPGDEYTVDGTGLAELLARYKDPEIGKEENRETFDRIQEFFQKLLDLPDAVLRFSRDSSTIVVERKGLELPLTYYGTGTHQLLILVTAILCTKNAICCIEEPEIHLHSRLQRQFLDLLVTETTNEYLISTHSPTLIDAVSTHDNVQVFHLQLENGATVAHPVLRDEDSLRALRDLGVKASDILQSNCILWVEGPSDRVYLKRWLELKAPDLVEGRHYSIMFYGGSLRSHLYVGRNQHADDLIHVLRINQNAVVIMDSDKEGPNDELDETKKRIVQECKQSGILCWVTDGREIENYLPERVVVAACTERVGRQINISMERYAKFDDVLSQALKAAGGKSCNYSRNKVEYAWEFAKHFELDDMDDQLKERIEEIVNKIRAWNK